MKRGRPSLARRLALSFVVATGLVAAGGLAITLLAMDATYAGVMHASRAVAKDLRRAPDGSLTIRSDGPTARLQARSPTFWALAIDDSGARFQIGTPPDVAVRFLEATPQTLTQASGIDFSVGEGPHASQARQVRTWSQAGAVRLAVGGVGTRDVSALAWLRTIQGVGLVAALLVLLVLTIALGLLLVPLVLNGLRPLARAAAAIDGSDPTRRLPEAGVVQELLPLVRSFNGALDRLEDALHRRARFMADAAHELRTPLTVLSLRIEDVTDGAARAELRRSVARLSGLVGQMLDAERLRGATNSRKPVDLVLLARSVSADVGPLAYSAGYALAFHAETDRVVVEADAPAVGRALTNLLSNAINHGGGAGTIRVRVGADATIEVSDEGPGVPEAERDRIFDPFHRLRGDRDGCGLGLHLVREIMRFHGGDARMIPGTSSGASFRLSFGPVSQA